MVHPPSLQYDPNPWERLQSVDHVCEALCSKPLDPRVRPLLTSQAARPDGPGSSTSPSDSRTWSYFENHSSCTRLESLQRQATVCQVTRVSACLAPSVRNPTRDGLTICTCEGHA